jgi:hypothetical protein
MKNLVSIFAGHDANVSFYDAKEDKYYTIEIERLVGLVHHMLSKRCLIQSL